MMSWTVPAIVVRVIDGDTIVVDLDLGWRVYRNREHLRVKSLFAPERGTPEGIDAKGYAQELLPVGSKIVVTSEAKPSFERTVGSIELMADVDEPIDFATAMIEAGHGAKTDPLK